MEFSQAATKMRLPLTVIDNLADEAWEAYQCQCILVRPDRFVAWAGIPSVGEAEAILRRAIGEE